MSATCSRRRLLSAGVALCGGGLAREASAAELELAVIVNAGNKRALSAGELEAIFRSTRRHWQGGDPIVAFNLAPGSRERGAFDLAVLRLSPEEVARYWIDRRIRGGDPAPRSVPNASLVIRLVAQLPSGIAYVPATLLQENVRVAAWVRKGVLATATNPLLDRQDFVG